VVEHSLGKGEVVGSIPTSSTKGHRMALKTLQELTALTESQKYWGSGEPHHNEYSALFKKLVKPSGTSDTVEGELLRAANKIYYDYYNNGFGNNWSGPLSFLVDHATFNMKKEESILDPYSTGKISGGDDPAIEAALDSLMDKVIAQIKAAGENLTPNEEDMYDNQAPDYVDHDDENGDDEDEYN
jgi:hypothetical protein